MQLNKSWFVLDYKTKKLAGFKDGHVKFPQALPEKFIAAYSKKGDKIFDPFAGFGTTLLAAQKLKRIGFGVEFEREKVEYINAKLKEPHQIILGDSLKLSSLNLPLMDLCFSSPPYMRFFDEEDPFSNYTKVGSYKKYLSDIGKIYAQVKKIMKKSAPVILEISNTFDENHPMTTLAWDIGKEISKHFSLERDFIFCFKSGKLSSSSDNNNHSYCLMFRNK